MVKTFVAALLFVSALTQVAEAKSLSAKSYATARSAAAGTAAVAIDKLSGQRQPIRTFTVSLNSKSKNGKSESFSVGDGPWAVNSQRVVRLKDGQWKGYVTKAGYNRDFQ